MLRKTIALILFFLAAPLFLEAGTTGKIAGVIKDKDTGEPLIGVNVMVEETVLGASTDIDGHYFILNVPVGTHSVRVSYIGYKEIVIQNVAVSLDLTTKLNFELEPTAIDIGEVVVVTAERSLIRKDETNTNIIKTAEDIKILPIRGLQNIASSVAGVVKQDNTNVMNIRGGRGSENAVYVDGVFVNDPYNYAVRVYLPNEAIEEFSVQTGGFNAEYGEAMSGIIAITTNSGTSRYFGSFEAITDELLSKTDKTLGTYSYGYNEYVASLGGPIIPGTKHSFFFSGTRRFQRDGTPSWGWAENDEKPAGFEGGIIPGNSDEDWSFTGKVKFQLGNRMDLKSSLVWTDRTFAATQDGFGMNPVWLFNTEHAPQWQTEHRSFNATFTHLISNQTYYEAKFNYFYTFRENYDRFFEDRLEEYGDPTFNPLPDEDENYGEQYNERISPDFFAPGAQFDDYFKNQTTYWGVDIDITHQLGKHHSFKGGLEYKRHTLREFRMLSPIGLAKRTDLTQLERYRLADVRFYGYDLDGNEVDDGDYFDNVARDETGTPISGFDKQAPYHPIFMNAYIQDKIEFGDLVLNAGLRYDRIDPNAWQFKELEADFDENGAPIPGTGMFGGDEIFDGSDVVESEVHDYFSPRLGVSFPVSEKTIFHAQYGKFFQAPRLADLYLSPFFLDAFVNRGGYFTNLDNPNLEPPKTTSYEIGFKQLLGNNASIQLTAFYKETEDLIQLIPIATDVTQIAFTNNGDFGVIKGLDIIFNLRRFNNFSANINYEMQFASGTGSASISNFDIAWQRGGKGNYPKFTMPLDFEQRHRGTINVDYRLAKGQGPDFGGLRLFENTGVNLLFSFNSGNPYTRMRIFNTQPFTGRYDNDGLSETPLTAVNAETTPWNYRMDLKLDREFDLPLGNVDLTFYAWILNLLNTENVQDVWITTGLAGDTGYLSTLAGQEYFNNLSAEEQQNFRMREVDFFNYGIPRQIRFGFRLSF